MKRKLLFLITIEVESGDIDEIGEFLAKDIENLYQNGEDLFEVKYIGGKNYEDSRL